MTDSRIMQTLPEIVSPEHTALVVWDVQNGMVKDIFNRDEFLRNTKQLIEEARRHRIPIFYTRITPLPRSLESPFRMFMMMRRLGIDDPEKLPVHLPAGSPQSEIHLEIAPREGDTVMDKNTASIFVGTNFENMLRNSGIKTVLFSGITTEIGIDSSARDAVNRSFYTIVISDCVSSQIEEMHQASLKTLTRVCLILPSGEITRAWSDSER